MIWCLIWSSRATPTSAEATTRKWRNIGPPFQISSPVLLKSTSPGSTRRSSRSILSSSRCSSKMEINTPGISPAQTNRNQPLSPLPGPKLQKGQGSSPLSLSPSQLFKTTIRKINRIKLGLLNPMTPSMEKTMNQFQSWPLRIESQRRKARPTQSLLKTCRMYASTRAHPTMICSRWREAYSWLWKAGPTTSSKSSCWSRRDSGTSKTHNSSQRSSSTKSNPSSTAMQLWNSISWHSALPSALPPSFLRWAPTDLTHSFIFLYSATLITINCQAYQASIEVA